MPPKAKVLLQALAATYPEAQAQSIVERWAENLSSLLESSAAAAEVAESLKTVDASLAACPPQNVELLTRYTAVLEGVARDTVFLKGAITVRIPEMKEEDNLGVNVQHAVLAHLAQLERKILGGEGSSKDAGSAAAFPGLDCKASYFAARAAIEEDLLKEKEPVKSPSTRRHLQQCDADCATKISLAYASLHMSMSSLIVMWVNNSKKLMNPRNTSDRMIA